MFNRKKINQLERDKTELLSIIEIWKREEGNKFSPLASYMYKTYHQLLNDLLNRDLEIRELKRQVGEYQYEINKSVCVCSKDKEKMKRIVDLEDFILRHIVRPFQYTGNFGEQTVKILWCDIDEFIILAKLKPEWWELVLSRLSRIDFYFAYWLHNIPIVQFIVSELKRVKHSKNLGAANEKSESLCICPTETTEQVCAEDAKPRYKSNGSREDV